MTLWEDEEFKKYVNEVKAFLGVDVKEIVELIRKSKCERVFIHFRKGEFGIEIDYPVLFQPNIIRFTFESPRRTRKFEATLFRGVKHERTTI